MASHRDLSARNQAHDDRTVHLGGLHFRTSREEIAAVVGDHGFHDCVFYWPRKPARYQHHTGWCFVEFADATTANSAREQLNGAQFGGRPAKAGRPSKSAVRAPSEQAEIASSVGQSGVPAITKKIADLALSGDQQREVSFVHPFSTSPTAQAKIDLEATRLNSYSQAWGPKDDAPLSEENARSAIHDRCMELDKAYMAAGVRSGFPFANSGLLARQYPNPAPDNDEIANLMPVLMIKEGSTDKEPRPPRSTPKLPDVKLAPLHDVEAHMGDGWRPFVQVVPDEADVEKKCDPVVDVKTTDQPWKDTERQFERGINATNYPGGSQWFPGAVLDEPVVDGVPKGNLSFCAAECISNDPEWRPQGHTGADLRTATNESHVPIKKRPLDIGMGWGGYDAFHQWQANGRRINPDDVEHRDWEFDARKMVLVEESTGEETTFDVKEGSALDRLIGQPQDGEGVSTGELKSLYAVLHPEVNDTHKDRRKRQFQKRYPGGLGGEY